MFKVHLRSAYSTTELSIIGEEAMMSHTSVSGIYLEKYIFGCILIYAECY
jgi:hypothetical protein